jgi:hypothetical protein
LLLNAGASILTVQAMLGHRHVDTTLSYTCLYDSTIAAHYYRAMGEVEARLEPVRSPRAPTHRPLVISLLALVDGLLIGVLSNI